MKFKTTSIKSNYCHVIQVSFFLEVEEVVKADGIISTFMNSEQEIDCDSWLEEALVFATSCQEFGI